MEKEMSKTVQTLLFKEFVRPPRVITGIPQNRDADSAITVSSITPWLPISPAKKTKECGGEGAFALLWNSTQSSRGVQDLEPPKSKSFRKGSKPL